MERTYEILLAISVGGFMTGEESPTFGTDLAIVQQLFQDDYIDRPIEHLSSRSKKTPVDSIRASGITPKGTRFLQELREKLGKQ